MVRDAGGREAKQLLDGHYQINTMRESTDSETPSLCYSVG